MKLRALLAALAAVLLVCACGTPTSRKPTPVRGPTLRTTTLVAHHKHVNARKGGRPDPAVGDTENASSGTWNGSPTPTFAYQWKDCNSTGVTCTNATGAGATTASYTVASADVGDYLEVVVTATNSSGSATKTSVLTQVVSASTPVTFNPTLPAAGISSWSSLYTDANSPTNLATDIDAYPTIHATWARFDVQWDNVEPTQGTFNWTAYDNIFAAAQAEGVNTIGTIDYTPSWANGGSSNDHVAPTTPSQFGTFAGQVAARYAPMGAHVWEIWNEPNIPQFWAESASDDSSDPAQYVPDLCAAYTAIHAADPQAIVLTGGASPAGDSSTSEAPQTWMADLYADGASNCFDGFAYHPYVDSQAAPSCASSPSTCLGGNWSIMYTAANNMEGQLIANGQASKKIWATEVGCNPSNVTGGSGECASRITTALADWDGYSWAGAITWFTYDPSGTAHNTTYGLEENTNELTAFSTAAGLFTGGGSGPAAPVSSAPPVISGTNTAGQTLSVSTGSWTGSPTGYTYQWQLCNSTGGGCASISGATSSTYQLITADVGVTVAATVTATNGTGSTTANASATGVIAAAGGGGSTYNCFASPKACGYPDTTAVYPNSAYVGPENGTTSVACSSLTPATGTVTLSTNQTYSGYDLTGNIVIDGTGVTLNDDCVSYNGNNSDGSYAVADATYTGLTVENSDIGGTNTGTGAVDAAVQGEATITHSYLFDCGECMGAGDSPSNSYIIANGFPAGVHSEDVYLGGGDTFAANHDTLLDPYDQTAEIYGDTSTSGSACTNHISITNSLLAGGGSIIYECGNNPAAESGGSNTGGGTLTFTGNDIARCTSQNGYQDPSSLHEVVCAASSAGPFVNSNSEPASSVGGDSHGYWPLGGAFGIDAYTFCSSGNGTTWSGNYYDDAGSINWYTYTGTETTVGATVSCS